MTGLRLPSDRHVRSAILFCAGLVLAELLLTTGSATFFAYLNADIPAGLLHGELHTIDPVQAHAEAIHARLTWLASVVFAVFASVAATIVAMTKILKEPKPLGWRLAAVTTTLIFLCALVATRWDVSRELLSNPVLAPTIGRFPVGGIDLASFAAIRRVVNALVAAATVAVVLALAVRSSLGLALEGERGRPASVAARSTDLHQLLLAGAAVLVAVVVTMAAWLNWPTAGLDKASPAYHAIVVIAEGVGLYWGAVFSLSLVLAYLPCVAFLNHLTAVASEQGEALSLEAGTRQLRSLLDLVALVSPFVSALIPVFLA